MINIIVCPYCGYEQIISGDRVVCEGCKKVLLIKIEVEDEESM